MEDSSRLFRVRKTLYKMLMDRGYNYTSKHCDQTMEQFIKEIGKTHPTREDLTMKSHKPGSPDEAIFVFFPEDTKVGVKPIRRFCERMKDENVPRGIIVVQEGITAYAKQALQEMAPRYILEQFTENELLVNITEHVLVPKHSLLTNDEKKTLLDRYKLKVTQLPRMVLNDPVSRYFGLSRGNVVKIIRNSETAGRYVTYRLVV